MSMRMHFEISYQQEKKFNLWKSGHKKVDTGAIGGRYTFSFSPTSLGQVVTVKDEVTGEELDLTEDDW